MTTYQVPLDQELSDALTDLANHLDRDFASRYVRELAGAAAPGNGWPGPAELPWRDRPRIAAAARVVADGHPAGDKLRALADGIDASLAQARANGIRV